MVLHASWVHGHSALLERAGAPQVTGKASVNSIFRGDTGDIIDLGGASAVACLRIGWGARFVVFDSGSKDREKSGEFWCHYAIPTPVIESGARAQADSVLINYETSDPRTLNIQAIHVWDGNKRILANRLNLLSSTIGDDEFDGGINRMTSDSTVTPNLSRLLRRNIINRPIYFGVGVSILIGADNAKNDNLEIRGVGVDFQLPR